MSLPAPAFRPLIVLPEMVTSSACRMLTPNDDWPLFTIRDPVMVTPEAVAVQTLSKYEIVILYDVSSLPTQTVAAGVWTFTMYWTGGTGATNDTVTIASGVSATASCAGFLATVPNVGSTWTSSYGSSGSNTTSPFTVSTSASQLALVIPAGGSLCVSVTLTHNTGGKPSLVYDGTAGVGDTNVVPPSIVVPESLLGLAGLVVIVPLLLTRLKRRRV